MDKNGSAAKAKGLLVTNPARQCNKVISYYETVAKIGLKYNN